MHVAVVGGGVAGLTAALRLTRAGHTVTVFEGSDRLGGKLRLADVAGLTVDVGAESMLARRPEGVDLAREVGLGADLVHPATASAAVWTRGALRPLPPTVMGMPADLDALADSGILGAPPSRASVPLPDHDLSVSEYVTARAGREVLDRLVEPLLGGVYAGQADNLSLLAAAPQLAALGADPLSSAVAARAAAASVPTTPVFAGISGGLGRLPTAVANASGATVMLDHPVRQIERTADRWQVAAGLAGAVTLVDADAVVLAVPGPAAARLLAVAAPKAAFALAGVEYAGMALVTAVFDDHIDLPGSGFLVPPIDGTRIKAATFASTKWGWLADTGRTVVRASLGRAGDAAALQRDDATLVDQALEDVAAAVGSLPTPAGVHVQRWGGALPQYAVGHGDLVEAVDSAVAEVPGLELCGAAYRGVGIPAVIASATAAVARLLATGGMMEP